MIVPCSLDKEEMKRQPGDNLVLIPWNQQYTFHRDFWIPPFQKQQSWVEKHTPPNRGASHISYKMGLIWAFSQAMNSKHYQNSLTTICLAQDLSLLGINKKSTSGWPLIFSKQIPRVFLGDFSDFTGVLNNSRVNIFTMVEEKFEI